MQMSVRLSLSSFLFLALLFHIKANAFSEYKRYGENLWELEFAGSNFDTNANYTRAGGSYDSLPNGNSFKLINIDLGARYCITNKMGLFAKSRVGIAESRDPALTRNNSQLNRASLGADLLMVDRAVKLIPEIMVHFPLAKNEPNTTEAQTSEGDLEMLGRLIVRQDFWRLHNQASLGMNYREAGRSSLITYGLGTEFDIGHSYLGTSVDGYSTMMQDESSGTPSAREANPLSVNAQSAIFNSVNPTLMSANFWYRFDNKKTSFQIGYGATVTGSNSAQGQTIFANMIYRFQTESSHPVEKQRPELERFKEETTDEVDQQLFQTPTPTPPPAPPKVNKNSRKRLQLELDQTEMQIELKAKKKNP